MRPSRLLTLVALLAACLCSSPAMAARPAPITLGAAQREHMIAIYGSVLTALAARRDAGYPVAVRRQGPDSNCDFIAAANGIQFLGGNGDQAYARVRELVPQGPIDYREGFYTLYGPNGSDRPFSLDNLGAAPEAFIGVYEALGYDATLLAAPPGPANAAFARAVHDQLALAPETSFAHLWITPRAYDAQARVLSVAATGEQAPLLYPYHEVAAIADPMAPGQLIVLDGLIGYPVALSLDQIAHHLRGFNKVVIVRQGTSSPEDRLRAQIAASAGPFAVVGLGGAFLTLSRQTWGAAYGTWGRVIGPPLQMRSGEELVVRLPGEYVLYERGGTGVGLARLGAWMRDDLGARGVLGPEHLRPAELQNALRDWAVAQFGSLERFHTIYGAPLTDELWLTPEVFHGSVLRGVDHALASAPASGYVVVLTERAMLVWSPEQGVAMVPLGLIFYTELRESLGV